MMKGNVVLDIVDKDSLSHGLIVKIPMDDNSEMQNARNYAMLTNMHESSTIPVEIKGLIPRPIAKHVIDGQNFYIEEKMKGSQAGDIAFNDNARNLVLQHAAHIIMKLHTATLKRVSWSDKEYASKIGNMIERVKQAGRYGQGSFDKLDRLLRGSFASRNLLIAQKHGDYSFANILIDPHTYHVQSIIDWDNSEYDHPLMLDMLNLIESTYGFRDYELGHTITDVFLKNGLSKAENNILANYTSNFGISQDSFVGYTLLYWLHHFDSQMKYGFLTNNPEWMEQNYYNVISAIDTVLS